MRQGAILLACSTTDVITSCLLDQSMKIVKPDFHSIQSIFACGRKFVVSRVRS